MPCSRPPAVRTASRKGSNDQLQLGLGCAERRRVGRDRRAARARREHRSGCRATNLVVPGRAVPLPASAGERRRAATRSSSSARVLLPSARVRAALRIAAHCSRRRFSCSRVQKMLQGCSPHGRLGARPLLLRLVRERGSSCGLAGTSWPAGGGDRRRLAAGAAAARAREAECGARVARAAEVGRARGSALLEVPAGGLPPAVGGEGGCPRLLLIPGRVLIYVTASDRTLGLVSGAAGAASFFLEWPRVWGAGGAAAAAEAEGGCLRPVSGASWTLDESGFTSPTNVSRPSTTFGRGRCCVDFYSEATGSEGGWGGRRDAGGGGGRAGRREGQARRRAAGGAAGEAAGVVGAHGGGGAGGRRMRG